MLYKYRDFHLIHLNSYFFSSLLLIFYAVHIVTYFYKCFEFFSVSTDIVCRTIYVELIQTSNVVLLSINRLRSSTRLVPFGSNNRRHQMTMYRKCTIYYFGILADDNGNYMFLVIEVNRIRPYSKEFDGYQIQTHQIDINYNT